MSIASELQDLETNVAAIQQAIIDKGGSVTGGLADLATDIEEMPSGDTPTAYGKVKVYGWSLSGSIDSAMGVDASITNAKQFQEFVLENKDAVESTMLWFNYENDQWVFGEMMGRVTVGDDAQLLAKAGISVNRYDSWPSFNVRMTVTKNTTTETEYAFLSRAEFNAWVGEGQVQQMFRTVGGVTVPSPAIKSIIIGEDITSIGDYFGCYEYQLEELDFSQAKSLTSIGIRFMADSVSKVNMKKPVVLPASLQTIGSGFFFECTKFNQPMLFATPFANIPDDFMWRCYEFNQPFDLTGVETIGREFLGECRAFSQTLTVPSSVQSIGDNFLYGTRNFIGPLVCGTSTTPAVYQSRQLSVTTDKNTSIAYTAGVSLTGTYASQWKTALPDVSGSSGTYRKTIVR